MTMSHLSEKIGEDFRSGGSIRGRIHGQTTPLFEPVMTVERLRVTTTEPRKVLPLLSLSTLRFERACCFRQVNGFIQLVIRSPGTESVFPQPKRCQRSFARIVATAMLSQVQIVWSEDRRGAVVNDKTTLALALDLPDNPSVEPGGRKKATSITIDRLRRG